MTSQSPFDPALLYIDLFCGAGGETTGAEQAEAHTQYFENRKAAKVIACVNHDKGAIASHLENHPDCLHFQEDVRTLPMSELLLHTEIQRSYYPDAKLVLWASLECTNYSRAKGGLARDADSRTLPNCLFMHFNEDTKRYEDGPAYLQLLRPDYLFIENVEEFMMWGPERIKPKAVLEDRCELTLIKDKKTGELKYGYEPLPDQKGIWYREWVERICALGYVYDHRLLNAADFGAYTSRTRYFGCFSRPGLPVQWPKATHAKAPKAGSGLKKWKAVRDVLDFSDEGASIFGRKKPLSEKTLERIFAGLIKYVAKGDKAFIQKYYSGRPMGKVTSVDAPLGTVTTFGNQTLVQAEPFLQKNYSGNPMGKVASVDGPAGAITTIDHHSLVQPVCLLKYNSMNRNGTHTPPSLEDPSPVVATQGRLGLINAEFLTYSYGNGYNSPVSSPTGTVTTKDRMQLVVPQVWLDKQYGSGPHNHQSVDGPAGALTSNPKLNLVQAQPWILSPHFDGKGFSVDGPLGTITAGRKHHYVMMPQWGVDCSHSVDKPAPTLIARMDKTCPQLIQAEATGEPLAVVVYPSDPDVLVRIKQFMADFGIVDIKMRMLRIPELKKITGFPADYVLKGTDADQKKFIGNAVVVPMAKALTEALAAAVYRHREQSLIQQLIA